MYRYDSKPKLHAKLCDPRIHVVYTYPRTNSAFNLHMCSFHANPKAIQLAPAEYSFESPYEALA
jgi:hypothetical protein